MLNSFVRSTVRHAAVTLPLLAACATANTASQQRPLSGAERLAQVRDSLLRERDLAGAEPAAERDEPRIRIIAPPVLGADRNVDASVRVSDDAYVMVVATDLDGRVRVVFPETPQESGFVKAETRFKLPTFFAGFGGGPLGGYNAYSVRSFYSQASARSGARRPPSGAIVAIASARPLQLERLTDRNGDWSEAKLEELLFGRSIQAAGYSLATSVSLTGQDFDTDFSGFTESAGQSLYSLAMIDGGCQADQTEPINFSGPRSTRYFEQNGTIYAVITNGDPCNGYFTRTVPVGPATPRVRDSLERTPAGTGSSAASRAALMSGPGRFTEGSVGDAVQRARQSSPMIDGGARVRPSGEGTLRFRPPEQLRTEPRVGERALDETGQPVRERNRDRLRAAPVDRAAPRPEPVREAPRPEPARSEPMRAEPSIPRAEPASGGKPTKND